MSRNHRNQWVKFKLDLLFYFSRKLCRPLVDPDFFMISLGDECNLRCRMCGCPETAKKYKGQELSTSEIKDIIDQIESWSKSAEITFSGGEPLVRKDILELIEYVCSKHLKLSINTNGVLIDDRIADRLASYPVFHLNFSVDGDSPEINDPIRGHGVFSKVLHSIGLLNEAKSRHKTGLPLLSLNFTIMKQNIGGISGIMAIAKKYGVNNVFFQPVVVDNTDVQKKKEYIFLNGDELKTLIDVLKKVESQAKESRIYAQIPPPSLLKEYFNAENTDDPPRHWKCFVGYNRLSISSFGHIYSCSRNMGETRKEKIKNIWYSKTARKIRKEFKACRQFCLQTCYARPDSESLYRVIGALFKRAK